MEVINVPVYIKLTEEERKTLRDAYDIFHELYGIIADNDCKYVSDICGNCCDRSDIARVANVLQRLAPAEKLEICN